MAEYDSKQVSRSNILKYGDGIIPTDHSLPWCDFFSEDTNVIDIACGYRHSGILTSSGTVYIFGCNFINGSNISSEPGKLVLVTFNEDTRIIKVVCGCETTFFLSDQGDLFACGLNHRGQLGTNSIEDQYSPILVNNIPRIKDITAGMCQAVAISVEGDVYVAGFSMASGHLLTFTRIFNHNPPFVDVSCGGFHYAGLCNNGLVFVIGSNSVGELGSIEDPNHVNVLSLTRKPVSLPTRACAIACGMFHTVALTVDGKVWAWGYNAHGQLGVGTRINCFFPTKMIGLEGYVITKIAAGGHHSALLTDTGCVLMCGQGENRELVTGQASLDVMREVMQPEMAIKQVACSWSYTLMLAEVNPELALKVDKKCEITNWESTIVASLKCPVCDKIMAAPIYLCEKGHNVCEACHLSSNDARCASCEKPFSGARNFGLEEIGKGVNVPCGACYQRMPIAELEKHNNECGKRLFLCPVQSDCGWSGSRQGFLEHASTAHKHNTWFELPHLFVHKLDDKIETNIINAFGEVFVLRLKFNRTSQVFKAVLQYISLVEKAKQFMFELEFITLGDDRNYIFRKDICSDVESDTEVLISDNCISLEKKKFSNFFLNNLLVCKLDIIKTESRDRLINIKALIEHKQSTHMERHLGLKYGFT